MPEAPNPKARPHPWTAIKDGNAPVPARARPGAAYAELAVTTNFTFLEGASHPDEIVGQAAALGLRAVAVTDRHTLGGVVRAHVAARECGLPLVVGTRIRLGADGQELLLYPTDLASYGRLCRLLTLGKRRAPKGECDLRAGDLDAFAEGLLAILLPPPRIDAAFAARAAALRPLFDDDRLSLAATVLYRQDDRQGLRALADLGATLGVPLVAVNDVHAHVPERQPLQDVLTCIREGCTLDEAGTRLFANAERHLKAPEEMARLFAGTPGAVARTVEIAERAGGFSLELLRYQYPSEVVPEGATPLGHLRRLTEEGARARYPDGVPSKVRDQIAHELALIEELDYAHYFLTVHDLVVFARSRGILCQGRGAAANSAVCYALGITAVDPARIDILFERFISRERDEPPDIDIDFEHERREEVIQYVYGKYGRHRAALTATIISYRARSAVREVGKALGFSLDAVDRLARNLDWWEREVRAARLKELGFDPGDPTIARLIDLAHEVQGFPRHRSQHVGGFVITERPLEELVPIENAAMKDRTVVEWDKDDIDAMGMLKVDVLGLGMLTCIRKAFELIEVHEDVALDLASVPPEDPAVYDMICRADTIGVFQIESRAQMSMLPRLRPRCYYDLVIEVAIVRPGPIQGQMVHPYLRRRSGEEPATYPDVRIEQVLKKTLGVPLFQEQVMALAVVAAGFTPGEADQLRRAIAAWKVRGRDRILDFEERFLRGMIARGYDAGFAGRCFDQIKGFGDYGFPESHAASFALLVYVSAWLKRHHPAAFACALLNSQPMGFYAPAQIVRDAREHGVAVRPVDAGASSWDSTLEEGGQALRLGFRLVKGLAEAEAQAVADAAAEGPFPTLEALWRRSGVRVAAIRALARADAFRSMGLDRQQALWQARALKDGDVPLFEPLRAGAGLAAERPARAPLPEVPPLRQITQDYQVLGLSLKAHPMSFLRETLERRRVRRCGELADPERVPGGTFTSVAGVVLVRQRPGTASGIVFVTLEDESGIANLIVRPAVYDRYRKAARHGVVLLAHGRIERKDEVVHLLARRLEDLTPELAELGSRARDFH